MRGTEEKELSKIRYSHKCLKDVYLKYFSSPTVCQSPMLKVRPMLMNSRE